MFYDITQLKSDLESVLHGTSLSSITNLYNLFFRAASELLLDLDPQETRRIAVLASPVYEDVFDYALPPDVKGNKVIDIRPQITRNNRDNPAQTFERVFDLTKGNNGSPVINIGFNNGLKTIRIDNPFAGEAVLLSSANQITSDNGTWSVANDASNLTEDNLNYVSGGSSLRFDLAAGGTDGNIVNSTLAPIDLSVYATEASWFIPVYLPTGSVFTSIEMRLGSSSTDYYSKTVTTSQAATVFSNGWNLLQFDWQTATVTGSPDVTAIDYINVIFNYSGTAQSGVRINNIYTRLGKIYEIVYYSKYLFRNPTTGAFQENVLTDSDLINLDTETYNLYINKVAQLAAQQNGGDDADYDIKLAMMAYLNGLRRYKAMYKSEILKPQQQYYQPDNRGRLLRGRRGRM